MEVKEIGQTKEVIAQFLNSRDVPYFEATYHGYAGFFIPVSDNIYPSITVTACNKDICIVCPRDILYIAIEDRKSVLYLTDRKIETHYSMDHWKAVLDENSFAQPHYSYLVNLNCVSEVTKEFVMLKCGKKEYKVYTSSRKLGAFKKAVVEFCEK